MKDWRSAQATFESIALTITVVIIALVGINSFIQFQYPSTNSTRDIGQVLNNAEINETLSITDSTKDVEPVPVPINPIPLCTDSDNGQNPDIFGETCVEESCQSDSCISQREKVLEYYCENGNIESSSFDCEFGCINGACVDNNPHFGKQVTAVILVNFDTEPEYKPFTPEEADIGVFDEINPESVNYHLNSVSYGNAWLTGDVYGWYTISAEPCGDNSLNNLQVLVDQAVSKLDAEVDFTETHFRRIMVIVPTPDYYGCPVQVAGMSWGLDEMIPIETNEGIINVGLLLSVHNKYSSGGFGTGTIIHELGHNFGTIHANSYFCGIPLIDFCPIGAGSPTSLSGGAHLNPVEEESIGWLAPENIVETSAGTQEYVLKPLALPSEDPQVLRILSYPYRLFRDAPDSVSYYYVSFRDAVGLDLGIQEPVVQVMARTADEGSNYSIRAPLYLVGDYTNSQKTLLRAGEEFVDRLSNLKIRVEEIGDDFARVKVEAPYSCVDYDDASHPPGTSAPSVESLSLGERKGRSYSYLSITQQQDYCDDQNAGYVFETICNLNGYNEFSHTKCPGSSECRELNESSEGDYCDCDLDGIGQISKGISDIGFMLAPSSVQVQGSYAYIANTLGDSITVIDLTNPNNPDGVGQVSRNNDSNISSMSYPSSIFVKGDYAYVTGMFGNSLSSIDVSDAYNPDGIAQITKDNDPDISSMFLPTAVYVQENLAYVTSLGGDSLSIIDVSDPNNLNGISQITKDSDPEISTMNDPAAIQVQGNYAYVANRTGNSLTIIDVSDPHNPNGIAQITKDSDPDISSMDKPTAIYVQGNYAYLTNSTGNSLTIVDVSDPNHPNGISQITKDSDPDINSMNTPTSIFVRDNYAYITSENGNSLAIISISNPLNPDGIAQITKDNDADISSMNAPKDLDVQGNYAYVANRTGNSLTIIDVSDSNHLNGISQITKDNDSKISTMDAPVAVQVQENYAYIASTLGDSLAVIDISDPKDPEDMGEITKDSDPDINSMNAPTDVDVQGNYAYVISSQGNSLTIIDIFDPNNLNGISQITKDSDPEISTMNDPAAIQVQGNYAYVANRTGNSLTIIDVSDPHNPNGIAQITKDSDPEISTMSAPISIDLQGNYAYVANYFGNSLTVIDISDPFNPNGISQITKDSDPDINSMNAPTDVDVQGNYAYVVSIEGDSLTIIDVSNPNNPNGIAQILNSTESDLKFKYPALIIDNLQDFPTSVYVQGNYAFVTRYYGSSLTMINISDPFNPKGVASITSRLDSISYRGRYDSDIPLMDSPIQVFVQGEYAFVISDRKDSLATIDISKVSACNSQTVCGNGLLEGSEDCDDGCLEGIPNTCELEDNADGCSSICTLESLDIFQCFENSLVGDVTGNNVVDIGDVVAISGLWRLGGNQNISETSGNCCVDVSYDGIFDVGDVTKINADWRNGTPFEYGICGTCNDGLDNDDDGLTDLEDRDC